MWLLLQSCRNVAMRAGALFWVRVPPPPFDGWVEELIPALVRWGLERRPTRPSEWGTYELYLSIFFHCHLLMIVAGAQHDRTIALRFATNESLVDMLIWLDGLQFCRRTTSCYKSQRR